MKLDWNGILSFVFISFLFRAVLPIRIVHLPYVINHEGTQNGINRLHKHEPPPHLHPIIPFFISNINCRQGVYLVCRYRRRFSMVNFAFLTEGSRRSSFLPVRLLPSSVSRLLDLAACEGKGRKVGSVSPYRWDVGWI